MDRSGLNDRVSSGIAELDAILDGGFPLKTLTVLGGAPGSGKTILSQQFAFHNATPERPAVFFQMLSEPTAKTLGYLQRFKFFDAAKIGKSIFFVDLGDIMHGQGLEKATDIFAEKMKLYKPAFVFVDSFKVFGDLAHGKEELRKFSYVIAIQLLVWECTAFLLGEYTEAELATDPLSSICDGIIILETEPVPGAYQGTIRISKLRGSAHSRNRHRMAISENGVAVYVLDRQLRGKTDVSSAQGDAPFVKSGIETFDLGLEKGFLRGSSQLISGPSGTGKSILALELLYRGARNLNEKGIYFSFDEEEKALRKRCEDFGWDVQDLIARGLLKIITFSRHQVLVERELLKIESEIEAFQAKRVVVDSLGILLDRVDRSPSGVDLISQLISIFRGTGCTGFLTIDVPYDSTKISKFGIEESMVDGIILLGNVKQAGKRQRTLEIYKLRNNAHQTGEFPIEISRHGIKVGFPVNGT